MFRRVFSSNRIPGCGLRGCVIVAIICLGLAGCRNLALYREEGFRDLQTSDYIQQVRPAERKSDFFGVSNRARQIERDMGLQSP